MRLRAEKLTLRAMREGDACLLFLIRHASVALCIILCEYIQVEETCGARISSLQSDRRKLAMSSAVWEAKVHNKREAQAKHCAYRISDFDANKLSFSSGEAVPH